MAVQDGKKVLVIDDDRGIVQLFQSRLKADGYEVVIAFDGLSGIAKVEQERPDLITLDVMMPEVNGYSVCGFLKSHQRYRSIPIIMVTVRSGKNDREFDESVRPEAYMTKPVNMDEFLGKVEELIGT